MTVDCLPLLDVAGPDTAEIITCRAYGREPMRVAAMGRAVLEGLAAGGVVGVVKHMPGHGRALVDSHLTLRDSGSIEVSTVLVALPTCAADRMVSDTVTAAPFWRPSYGR